MAGRYRSILVRASNTSSGGRLPSLRRYSLTGRYSYTSGLWATKDSAYETRRCVAAPVPSIPMLIFLWSGLSSP